MTDENNFVTANIPLAADTISPAYPRIMYHPTKGQVEVVDSNAQAALVASDSQWTTIDPTPTT